LRDLEEIDSLEDGLAANDFPGRLGNEPEEGHGADALAGARFPHDSERLSGIEVVADPVDGLDDAVLRGELDDEVPNREKRLRHERGAGWDRGRRGARRR